MKCSENGLPHSDSDFDGEGLSTTGCDCRTVADPDLNSAPSLEGPGGEESYEEPEGDDG